MNDPREKKGLALEKLTQNLQSMKSAFQMALLKPETVDRFIRSAITQLKMNPMLAECDPQSLYGAFMQTAQLNLDITLGQAWVIPYWSGKKGCNVAQFQIGYQGLIDLFYRHQLASELYVEIVYKNDQFEYSLGTDRKIIHKPAIGERGDMIAVYAVAKLSSGAQSLFVMSVPELHKYKAQYSKPDKQGRHGVWDSDFESMAKKTAIKQVLKYMPKAVEIQRAMIVDSTATIINPTTMSLDTAQVMQITDESDEPTGYAPTQAIESKPVITAPPTPPADEYEPYIPEVEIDYANEAECQEIRKHIYPMHERLRESKVTGFTSDDAIKKTCIKHIGKEMINECSDVAKLTAYRTTLAKLLGMEV